ncbi:proton-associated sugar transporter A isoform X2 [Cylas formicarius]|uniref:proton-associated sugar transporter A isoform X2 n=1 Tax=Cylas formicarius TaxID=197179 RepID=UPI0029586B55|nr:proton-associated sugar transporter A isoform X2 [Cylas formicarius]XP_060526490.1 proton-associated sugar transporter A isoform X2 [Cylas formicarius]XP_060526491.1 proton-associated sugar transporter A isoform X2 [Cylas formicarius]
MTEKLYEYQGCAGRIHGIRDNLRERYRVWKETNPQGVASWFKNKFYHQDAQYEDYSHIFRRKTRRELTRVSAAVMGIEFSYAAETAFVSPTLLKIGIEHKHMTLVWALSPLIGFFLTPVLGSLSDRCPLRVGRRRPFIFAMSVGVLLGLVLVPNGEGMGYGMGDPKPPDFKDAVAAHRTSARGEEYNVSDVMPYNNTHPWGVAFTVIGTVLLDFDADACQSPARAYLLDVTVSDDHAKGLSTFTVMAGLGGFLGYAMGGVNWDATYLGRMLGGHVKAVFTLTTLIFVVCVAYTITSFKEMPLHVIELRAELEPGGYTNYCERGDMATRTYGAVDDAQQEPLPPPPSSGRRKSILPDPEASLVLYLRSIVYMPFSIRMLCLTNLFCWMAHVCYSLYFTDFVGEAVFNGNPTATEGTVDRELYEEGVRFGCWGMSMYSLSCACYSLVIERLISRFKAKRVYVGGLLVYSSGMGLMALTKNKIGVILFSWTAGVMYSTLFTMPYLIVAHYHAKGTFEVTSEGEEKVSAQIRGIGTDVALVSSMVFLAQFVLSMCMGTIVSASGTTTAVVAVASILALFGAVSASQVVYLDL